MDNISPQYTYSFQNRIRNRINTSNLPWFSCQICQNEMNEAVRPNDTSTLAERKKVVIRRNEGG